MSEYSQEAFDEDTDFARYRWEAQTGETEAFDRWLAEVERAAAEKGYAHADATITEHLVSVGSPLPPAAVTGWPANPYRRNEGAKQ